MSRRFGLLQMQQNVDGEEDQQILDGYEDEDEDQQNSDGEEEDEDGGVNGVDDVGGGDSKRSRPNSSGSEPNPRIDRLDRRDVRRCPLSLQANNLGDTERRHLDETCARLEDELKLVTEQMSDMLVTMLSNGRFELDPISEEEEGPMSGPLHPPESLIAQITRVTLTFLGCA